MSIKLSIFIILVSIIFLSSCAKKDIKPLEKKYDEYAVVSNQNMPDLSPAQVKDIFLKKLTLIEKLTIVPINLPPKDELRLKFEKKVLEMDFEMLKVYWAKQYKLGVRPPVSMKSQESVESFLKKVDGSLGYMRVSDMDKDLKIIYKWRD